MAVDVYFRQDVGRILAALALGANRYHPDYGIALCQVAIAFGIENADPMLVTSDRPVETRPGPAMSHLALYPHELER